MKSRKRHTLREKLESYTSAITFAEAGVESAQETFKAELSVKNKILIIGHDDTFTKILVDYATSFAGRMGYEIVALNVSPIDAKVSGLVDYCDMLCEQFVESCKEGINTLYDACKEKCIDFNHLVRFGDVDKCIEEVCREIGKVEYVMVEPTLEESSVVPVFCLSY